MVNDIKLTADGRIPISVVEEGYSSDSMFGPQIMPAKWQKQGEIFDDDFVAHMKKVTDGLVKGFVGFGLAILSFIYLPKTIPFIFIPIIFAFIGGTGFGWARIWMWIYADVDRATAALRPAGGNAWIALAKQEKNARDAMIKEYPLK